MSEQHEQDHEVVPVEVDQDHEVVDAPAEPESEHSPTQDDVEEDGAEAGSDSSDPVVEADGKVHATSNDLQEEHYERATLDPEFAHQQAIQVDEGDRGPAWEHGSLAEYERTEALRAQSEQDEADHADEDGEV